MKYLSTRFPLAASLCLALGAGLLTGCEAKPGKHRWNVLVVTLDTTRADRLGPYGYPNAGTPHYDALAAEGFVFEQASSSAPVTLPSHSTIFTGTYPPHHGVRDNGAFRLPEERLTLAEILREHGWDTGAVVASVPVTRQFGIAQGFDFFDDDVSATVEDLHGRRITKQNNLFFDERTAVRVNDAMLPWLRQTRSKPFFAWIHYWDAHQPQQPPSPYAELYPSDPYQGEIAYVDSSFGVVVDALRETGQWNETLVVVVADHGEGLGQHREDTHSLLAYETTLHVPMILKIPGLDGGARVSRRVGTVDIVPTILDFLGLEVPAEVQGESLRTAIQDPAQRGRERDQRSVYYAEALTPRLSFGWGELRVLYHQGQKYIHGPRPELYDLHADPFESSDLIEQHPEQQARRHDQLQKLLDRIASDAAADATHDIDAETKQKLAALGYISAEGDSAGSVIELLRSDGTPPQERVYDNSLVSSVKGHLGAGRWSLALEGARALIELDPANAFYRSLEARSLLGLDRPSEAADAMENLDSRAAIDEAIVLNVARLLFADGERARAQLMVQDLVDERESGPSHYLLGEMFLELGDITAGRRELEAAVRLVPKYARALQSLAILLTQIGDIEPAGRHFETLVATYPLEPRYRYNYAAFLLGRERRGEARAQLRRAVELGPTYWQAHLMLLALDLDQDDLAAADSTYRHIVGRCTDLGVLDRAAKLMQRELS